MAQQQTAANGRVKILSVVWFTVLPPKFGGQKAVAFFNEHLAEYAELVCLCAKTNETAALNYNVQNILPVGKKAVVNPFAWRRIYTVAKRDGATHLLLEFPYYGIAAMLCKKWLGCKLIVNTHNVEHLRFRQQKKWWWRLLFQLERMTLRKADAVFFKTEDDLKNAEAAFGLERKRLSVVPYGIKKQSNIDKAAAQIEIRRRHRIGNDERLLLFAGTLDYAPNADAVVDIANKLIPLLDQMPLRYKIIVCGRNRFKDFSYLNDLKNENLIITGEAASIETYFEAADVFINPVLSGGGVQTKTMDALSYQLNVVCFASKAAGIEGAKNKIFAVADGDWQVFATAVANAIKQNEPTPDTFFEKYNWRTIAANAYQKIRSS